MIDIATEAHKVLSTDPGHRIRTLDSGLPDFVENAKVMSEEQFIGNVKIRLARHSRKRVVPARKLAKRGVYNIAPNLRREGAGQGLIAHEHVMATAGSADAASIQRGARELVQITTVLDVVSQ